MVNLDRDVKEIKNTLSSLASRVTALESKKKPAKKPQKEKETEEASPDESESQEETAE